MGHVVGALSDLDRAVELSEGGDPDVLHQRGMVYHKVKTDFSSFLSAWCHEPCTLRLFVR